jgi:hypothetical protein
MLARLVQLDISQSFLPTSLPGAGGAAALGANVTVIMTTSTEPDFLIIPT